MKRHRPAWSRLVTFSVLCAGALCACGGGAQQTALPVGGAGKSTPGQHVASVSLVIKVPPKFAAGAAKTRTPQFVSPAVRSVAVTVTSGGATVGAPMNSNVVCTSGGCSATVVVLAPIGAQDTFTVVAYDGLNATGNVLSTASVVYNVPAGGNVSIPIVLAGVAAAIKAVTVTNPHPPTGSVATSSVTVSAIDASGAVIAGPYAQPINVQLFENDPDGVFGLGNSTVTNAVPLTLLHSSSEKATVTLAAKAGGDVTTPDDATVVATVAGRSFVPNTSPVPALATIGEVTTACPASSATCVYYPSGDEIIGAAPNAITTWGGSVSGALSASISPGSAQDSDGGKTIWNLSSTNTIDPLTGSPDGLLLSFNTVTDTFGVTPAAGLVPGTALRDIAGTLWATGSSSIAGTEANPAPPPTPGMFRFSTAGIITGPFIPDPLAPEQALAATLDSAGRLWVTQGTGFGAASVAAISPATNSIISCAFSGTDPTFVAGSSGGPLSVAGSTVWASVVAFDANSNQISYLVQIPSALGAGCAQGALTGLPFFRPASANTGVGPGVIEETLVDSSGNLLSLEPTVVTRITNAGLMTNVVDVGAATSSTGMPQSYVSFALDATQSNLYLLDNTAGTLDRASNLATASGVPLSIPLPPVLGAAGVTTGSGILSARIFFQPDGSLWVANAQFNAPTALYSILGSVGQTSSANGGVALSAAASGLVRINLANATFVHSTARFTRSIGQIRALAHERYLRSLRRNQLPRSFKITPAPAHRSPKVSGAALSATASRKERSLSKCPGFSFCFLG